MSLPTVLARVLFALLVLSLFADEVVVPRRPTPYASLMEAIAAVEHGAILPYSAWNMSADGDGYEGEWMAVIDHDPAGLDMLLAAGPEIDDLLLNAVNEGIGEGRRTAEVDKRLHRDLAGYTRLLYVLALRGHAQAGALVQEVLTDSDPCIRFIAARIARCALDVPGFRERVSMQALREQLDREGDTWVRPEFEHAVECLESEAPKGWPHFSEGLLGCVWPGREDARSIASTEEELLAIAEDEARPHDERVRALARLGADAVRAHSRPIVDLARSDLQSGVYEPMEVTISMAGACVLAQAPCEETTSALVDLVMEPGIEKDGWLVAYLISVVDRRLGLHFHTLDFLRWHLSMRRLRQGK